MLGLFSYGMQMGAIRASPPSQCNDLTITPHWSIFKIRCSFSFILSSELFQIYRWYCSLHWIYKHSRVFILGRYWGGSIFVKDEGCICLFCLSQFFTSSLKFLWGWDAFSCCAVLYSFHLVFCGHSDLSYVAHFPKCIECE